MVLDQENRCIVNRALDSLEIASADISNPPQISRDEMLLGSGEERKRLSIDSIRQVTRFSGHSSHKLKLTFSTKQRPYQLEFLEEQARDDFCTQLQAVLSTVAFCEDV